MIGREIVHVDMDAFYASVEVLDNPALEGLPLVVGGASRRGVVAAASYAARTFGVRSAMPMRQALERCPQAIVRPPRMARYQEVSECVFEIFHRFTPLVEGLSLDEAFLDVTGSRSLFGDGEAIATKIRCAIRCELGLTASAGVAPSKFVAKIASDLDKPDGLVVVRDTEVRSFLASLPIERMWGIGPKTAPRLRDLGFSTLGDLANAAPSLLESVLGQWGLDVSALSRGEDPRDVVPDRAAKSVGAEETFEHDLTDRQTIEATLLAHATRIAERLSAEGVSGVVVTLKLKHPDFQVETRRLTLPHPIWDSLTIYDAARKLLARSPIPHAGYRLTGVSVSSLSAGVKQPVLFPDMNQDKRERLEKTRLEIEERFQKGAVTRASLVGSDPKQKSR